MTEPKTFRDSVHRVRTLVGVVDAGSRARDRAGRPAVRNAGARNPVAKKRPLASAASQSASSLPAPKAGRAP